MRRTSEHRDLLERLNRQWRVAGDAGGSAGRRLLRRFRALAGRLLLGPQETFNAAVVEYINTTLDDVVQTRVAAEEVTRYRESLAARERRLEQATRTILAGQEEIRTAVAALRQTVQNLTRTVEHLGGTAAPGAAAAAPEPSRPPGRTGGSLESGWYVGFEDRFRGSDAEIRGRLEAYAPVFQDTSGVLDIGCGRGEFLSLLRARGISARGIDANPAMVDVCREQGLDAVQADALSYLRSVPSGSLGGLFAAQVIEHFEPEYLTQFVKAAFDALRSGAPIVLETINPGCWFAFFESYIRDITHARPIHPDTLKYLLVASGFQQVEIRYRAPYPDVDKLQPIREAPADPAALEQIETINANVEKINRLLFTYLDYAAVGRRP